VRLSLDVPPELRDAYAFKPGQHLTFRHRSAAGGPEIRRSFSICSTPSSGLLQVGVKLLPGGEFSSWVHSDVRPGTVLSVMTPAGRFVPRVFRHRHHGAAGSSASAGSAPTGATGLRYAAVCAGSGITPVLSILGALLESAPDTEFALLYGNRSPETVMFAAELVELEHRFGRRLTVEHVFSRRAADGSGRIGRIDAAVLTEFIHRQDPAHVAEWFLCGPAALVDTAVDVLHAAGVGRRQIHRELFWLGPDPDPETPTV
jgi:ring-1,2-phenylacetyl-CoA epoxidase subunit PaaE